MSEPQFLRGTLLTLIKHCETYCVAGCCGLDAFDFSAAASFKDKKKALEQINEFIRDYGENDTEFTSTTLNFYGNPKEWIKRIFLPLKKAME